MRVDYIAASIPAFFILMGLELAADRALARRYYRLGDSIAGLGCGVVQQISGIFLRTATVAGYAYLYAEHRLLDVSESSIAAWVAIFVGVDLCYYWFHRLSHEVNILWAAHVVHHQSEEYNLSVALRQAAFQPLFSWVFYLPLALLGFPPLMFAAMLAFSTLYQFWIHTRFIPKLGPLEWILNTPSHHRVHHGRNPRYIDKNHGATLIVWDRLFGTFEPESEEVVYGVTEPLASFNPVWANFHYLRDLLDDSRRAARLRDAVKLWFMPPGWKPEAGRAFASRSVELDASKYDPPLPGRVGAYVAVQFLLALVVAVVVLDLRGKADERTIAALGGFVLLSCATLGGLLDRRSWAYRLEAARLLLVALAALGYAASSGAPLAIAAALIALVSVGLLASQRAVFAGASGARRTPGLAAE